MRYNRGRILFILKSALILVLMLFVVPTDVSAVEAYEVTNYGYTGGIQSFTAPYTGYYQLEAWGAAGGGPSGYRGGFGGYSTGVVRLNKGDVIYVVVGGAGAGASHQGQTLNGGYNGGGRVNGNGGVNHMTGSGGGATHFATVSGVLSSLSGYKGTYSSSTGTYNSTVILLVAGGGGGGRNQANHEGAARWGVGASGGGNQGGYLTSNYGGTGQNRYLNESGTQSSGYSFGQGGTASANGAGGGGFFGGYNGDGAAGYFGTGGGGSGYIGSPSLLSYKNVTKHMVCYDCVANNGAAIKTVNSSSYNASPVSDVPKSGSGYARITLIEKLNTNPKLASLEFEHGIMNRKFDPDVYEYDVVFASDDSTTNITAIPQDTTSTVVGGGAYNVEAGTHDLVISSTSESGAIALYLVHITRTPSSYKYLNNILVDGRGIDGFNPTKLEYTINVPYDYENLNLAAVKGRTSQTVYLPTDTKLNTGNNVKNIIVISEDGNSTTTYTINVNRAHTSLLKSLSFKDFELSSTFDPDTLSYTVNVMSSTMALKVNAVPYDEEATITLSGFGYIKKSGVGTITVTEPNSEKTVYKVVINKEAQFEEIAYDFPYTGRVQQFSAPYTGYYLLETWGAQGGNISGYTGGFGGYARGVVYLNKGETLYVVSGGAGVGATAPGQSLSGGYNGGGSVTGNGGVNHITASGGGATHIATTNRGLLANYSNYRNELLIVSGGGGGARNQANHEPAARWGNGGSGGGYMGGALTSNYNSYTLRNYTTTAGTQTSGNAFGVGGSVVGNSAGGGGYFGGYAGYISSVYYGTGGGGSGYIGNSKLISYKEHTKSMYCYNCNASSNENTYTVNTSKYSSTPTSYYAKSGAGYARITLLSQPSENNFLSKLTVKATTYDPTGVGTTTEKTYTPTFDMELEDYYVTVEKDETSVTLSAKPEDSLAKIEGLGTFDVPSGETIFTITVTAESGAEKEYKVHVTRPKDDNPYPYDIQVAGLVPSLCGDNPMYCDANAIKFDMDTHTYYLTVPSRIKQLWFNVTKGHPYQVVSGEGKITLSGGENTITIEIVSEDSSAVQTYTYIVTRDMTGNTDLADLKILDPEREINYNPDITEYYASVENNYTRWMDIESPTKNTSLVDTVQLYIEPDDDQATYTVSGPDELSVGMNKINVTVTARDGKIKIYVLNIYRERNSNVYLSDLEIRHNDTLYELSPEFNKINTGTYNVTVPNDVDSVNIIAHSEANTTTVSGTGNKNLYVGNNSFSILTSSESGDIEIYKVNIYREKNSNAYLSSLTVDGYTLEPEFNKEVLEYALTVDEGVSTVDISAVPEVSTTIYKLLDNNTVKVGENKKRIMSIAEDGTTLTYEITITRPSSSDNTLQDLIVYDDNNTYTIDPVFDKDTTEYTLVVPNEVNYVDVLGTKNNSLAQVSGNGRYNLSVGDNLVNITVTSESQDAKTYSITITRLASSNANIQTITLSNGTVLIPRNVENNEIIDVTVTSDIDELVVDAVPEIKTTLIIGKAKYDLQTGLNEIVLATLAEDKTTSKIYTLRVTKLESDNNYIRNLILKEGSLTPVFDKEETNYTAIIPYSKKNANFIVTLDDEKSTYEIKNASNLSVGENEITIEVTAENGDKKEYTVTVTRLDEETSYSTSLLKLKTDTGTLRPAFNVDETYYEVEVPYTTKYITVTAESVVEYSTVTGTGTYTLEVGENLIKVKVTSAEGTYRDYQIMVIRKQNTESRLSNLIVEGSTLTPIFDMDTYSYDLTTNSDHLEFTNITTLDPNATYEIIGNSFDDAKAYEVKIVVTAENGTDQSEYTLNVNKLPSNNNNLARLEVEGYSITPEFKPNITVYNLDVENNINSINIIAEASDSTATIEGDGMHTVSVGENYFTVEVKSQSGNIKTYTIIVNKTGSSNTDVTNLEVLNGIMTPTFDNEGNDIYNVEVEYSEESLDLNIVLASEKSTYEVVGNNLQVGSNIVKVLVHAENNTTREITLNVTRKNIVSALLKNIKVKDYELSPTFNTYVNSYDILVDNETESLVFTEIETLDPNATYVVKNNSDFVVGNNEVEIEVTSSNGHTKETYVLNVNRQAYSNTYLDYLYTNLGDVTPTFLKTTMEYNIEVDYENDSIELFAESVDKSVKVETIYNGVTREAVKENGVYNSELGTFDLVTGENKVAIVVTSQSGIKRTYYLTILRKADDNNFLASLSAKVGATSKTLTPEFDKMETNYTVNVEEGTSAINIQGVAESPLATVSGNGVYSLKGGENNIEITVTGENGVTRIYTLKVIKPASDNNHLIELIPSIGELTPEFSYDVDPSTAEDRTYTLNLDSSAAYLSFEAITEDDNATVSGLDRRLVPDGKSTREIIVTAEDGTTRTYIININKERSDDASLTNLYVQGYDFIDENNNVVSFDKDVYDYYISVPNNKIMLLQSEVVATATDSNSVITKAANLTLQTKTDNIYTVLVTAPDGFTKQTYRIHIKRELNNVASLNSLTVNKGYLTSVFNPNVKEYTWMVYKNAVLNENDVIAVASDPNASIYKTPYLVYQDGEENVYEVQVVSEDGNVSVTYRLHLQLDLSTDATLGSLTVDKGYYEPEFDPSTYTYDVYEYVDTDSITVTAVPNQDTSTVVSGNGLVELTSDLTTHYITVEAENGASEEYTLNIHKSILTDKGLIDLGLNGLDGLECTGDRCVLSPQFNTELPNYSIKVPYEYEDLDIYVEKNSQQKVKYKIGDEYITDYKLPVGKTSVTIEVYDGMNVKTMEYTMEINRCKSSNTNLKSLEITGYDLEPVFNKNTLEYTVNVPSGTESVEILAEPEDSNAAVSVTGYNYLEDGENEATIEVFAPDGNSKTYIVHIVRSPLYNSYIRNITVSTGVFWMLSPNFRPTTFDYTATVASIYDRVTIEAVPAVPTTVITGTGEYDIVTGSNKFRLVATAENGQTSVYTINVIKQNSENVNLTNLYVDEGDLSPSFEKGITNYEVSVSSEVDKLTVHAVLEDKTSSYIVTGDEHLVTGDNIVNVIVMNDDKSVSKTYQITVHKAASPNNYLSDLKVKDDNKYYDLNIPFDKLANQYNVTVPHDVDKVIIEAIPEVEEAIVQGIGEENLSYGLNTRDITVTAEDGSTNTYKLNIYRDYNLNLKDLISDIGELDPEFDSNELEYHINLPKEADKITFIALKESNLVSVTGNGTYTLEKGDNEIEFVVKAPDDKTKTYKVIVNRAASDNNNLSSLMVHEGAITPVFDKDTLNYTVYIRDIYNMITLDVELEDPKATYEIIGNNDLQLGSNTVIVRVIAEDGTPKDYEINVVVQDDSEFSNRLLSITLSNGTLVPDFDSDINYYTATVPNSVSDTVIEVIKENIDASVTGVGKVDLVEGRNVFNIPVTSKDGIVNTYTLTIYRLGTNDATLSSLIVRGHTYTPIFNKAQENYQLTVGSNVDSLDIVAVPSDPKSKVEIINNENLQTGINVIDIKVTAPDNETVKTYKLTVTKSVSTNNYLSSLTVNGYTYSPDFDKTVSGPYVVNLSTNVNNVVIDAEPEEATTTVAGTGKHDLVPGQNVIQITTTSESGSIRTYTVIVNKAKNSDSTLKNILLSDGTLVPTFDSAILSYTVDVPAELDRITVTGTPNTLSSKVTGNGTYELDSQSKIVELVVEADDGSKTTYQVTINKPSEYSSKLASLIIKDGELAPGFNKNTLLYTINIPNEVTSLDMTYVPEDSEATVNVTGNENFVVGSNTVTIEVISRDSSSTTTYEIEVMRQPNASNYLKNLYVTDYDIEPEFNKQTLYYEVAVPNNVDNITINAILEDPSATVTGDGNKSLVYGNNTFYVNVTSASGIVRTYTVKVNRTLETENYLLSLITDKGTLDPVFDKETNVYNLVLPEKTTEINLIGTSSPNTTVIGLGKVEVTEFSFEHLITVTSQKGDINIYKLNISKPASSNTELVSLTPSSSTLSPEYSNSTLEYTMEVEDNVNMISFEVISVDSNATVTGNEITNLSYGNNEIEIVVTAEDKTTTRTIKISIVRKKDLISIIPDSEKTDLILSKGQTENVTYELNPTDTTYNEVEWVSLDENIATVDQDGNITAVEVGSTVIQIVSKHNNAIFATITVNVINDKITSSVYEVNHYMLPMETNTIEVEHVIGIEPETLLDEFIPNFDNNPSTLHVFDEEDNEIINPSQEIGSYMKIKLIIDNRVYDELVIIVRGDFDGDGYVTATDLVGVKNIILGKAEETYIRNKICDIDKDSYVAATDLVAVKNFILGKGQLNNKE